jgi:hypothetical protein
MNVKTFSNPMLLQIMRGFYNRKILDSNYLLKIERFI